MFFFYNNKILPSYIVNPSENSLNLTVSKHMAVLKKKTKTKTENRKTRKEFHFRETLSFTNRTQM